MAFSYVLQRPDRITMQSDQFESSPDGALHAIATHEGAVLVDLDETLYLHNSTEDFIGSAWPRPLAFFLIKLRWDFDPSLSPWLPVVN